MNAMWRHFWFLCWLVPAVGMAAKAPTPSARAWLLIDHDSGAVLTEHEADAPAAPASLTKLMTATLIFERLRDGRLRLGEPVPVSERAAAMNGSRLFLRAGQTVPLETLMQGMLILSANDATMAAAEHAGGGEEAFVREMNQRAIDLGLTRTTFVNCTGLDAGGQRSTARDLTRLASHLIREFPEEYRRWFGVRAFTFNDIPHHNRNALLWRDASVDGVKTGRTRLAGHNLIASAQRNTMRLIATVMGAPVDEGRFEGSQRLLDYGFRHFETRQLYGQAGAATKVRVWYGEQPELSLGLSGNSFLTLPRGLHDRLQSRLVVSEPRVAPIAKGQRLGTLVLDLDGRNYAELPLVALRDIGAGNLFQRFADWIELWWQ